MKKNDYHRKRHLLPHIRPWSYIWSSRLFYVIWRFWEGHKAYHLFVLVDHEIQEADISRALDLFLQDDGWDTGSLISGLADKKVSGAGSIQELLYEDGSRVAIVIYRKERGKLLLYFILKYIILEQPK